MKICTMVLATAACVLLTKGVYAQNENLNWSTVNGSNNPINCGQTFTITENSSDADKTIGFELPTGNTGTITVTLTKNGLKKSGSNKDKIIITNGGTGTGSSTTWVNGTSQNTQFSSTTGQVIITFNDDYRGGNSTFTITVKATCTGYTLSYDINCAGQQSAIPSQTGSNVVITNVEPADCNSNSFTSWNTAANGTGSSYLPGDRITLTANTTLYAQYYDCSSVLDGKSISAGEYDDDGYYFNACKGDAVQLSANVNGETSGWDWKWYLNAHDANPQTKTGSTITITPEEAVGYDINISAIDQTTGCKLATSARMRVSGGLVPSTASYTIPNGVCVNETREVTVGSETDAYDIVVPSQVVHVSALKGQSETTFIPDGKCSGMDACYESAVTYTEFDDNATISSANDIEYIRINMEHSFIGDIQISLECPNGQTAIILEDYYGTDNGGKDAYTYTWPYEGSSHSYDGAQTNYTHWPVSFGIPSRTDGNDSNRCNTAINTPGTGWDYCWSNLTTIDGNHVRYANSTNSYVYETANHVDIAPRITHRSVKASNLDTYSQFYKPRENFYEKLRGCPLNGTWKVKVCDSWGKDNGYVFNWDLKLSDDFYTNPWQYNVEIESLRLENPPSFVTVSTEEPTTLLVEPDAVNGGQTYTPTLYVIDNLGCESQTPINLTVEVKKPFTPTISGTDKICFGQRAGLTASHNIDSPTSTPTYQWADELDETDIISENAVLTTDQLMEGHTYIVTVTYRTCTATMSKEVEVSVPDPEDTGIGDNDFVWAGINDGDEENWNVSGNWIIYNATTEKYSLASGTTLPTSANNAFVVSFGTSCVSKDPTLSAESYTKNLVIGEGHTVTVSDKKLNIAGDLINDGTLSAASGTIEFNGNDDQKIKNSQTFKNIKFNQQSVNKITSLDENDPVTLTIKGGATFTKGIVDADVIFTQGNDAKVANASSLTYNSFVNKSVTKKEKFDSFVFPTGNDNVLGTVTATVPGAAGGCAKVTVSYHHNDGENADGSHGFTTDDMPRWWNKADMCATNEANFDHVSNYEFWNVNTTKELTGVTLKVSSASEADHYTTEDYTAGYVFGTMYSNSCWMQNSASNASSSDGKTIVLENVTIPAVSSRATSPSFMTFASINPGSVLPIELVDFTAKCESYGALLEWATASERDNDYFIIEHSNDAMNFSEIARIAGAGNSINTLNYSYVDYNMFGGDNYYRLIQVDYDGTRSASEIIALNCGDNENEPAVEAYPNPFNSELEISLKNFNNMPAKIELFDMLGKLVYFEEVESTLNQYDTTLQLGHLAQATYTMRVCCGDKVMVKQIVKR